MGKAGRGQTGRGRMPSHEETMLCRFDCWPTFHLTSAAALCNAHTSVAPCFVCCAVLAGCAHQMAWTWVPLLMSEWGLLMSMSLELRQWVLLKTCSDLSAACATPSSLWLHTKHQTLQEIDCPSCWRLSQLGPNLPNALSLFLPSAYVKHQAPQVWLA